MKPFQTFCHGLGPALALLLCAASANAAPTTVPKPGVEGPTAGERIPSPDPALHPLTWDREPGQGLGFGLDVGTWGPYWAQGLRVNIPFGRHFAVHTRGLYLADYDEDSGDDFSADLAGRLDFIGRSAVFLNLIRLYGGGGAQLLQPIVEKGERKTRVGGGGHFGFEFFHNPQFSFFLEVGGQGGPLPGAGATVLAGMAFYPWTR